MLTRFSTTIRVPPKALNYKKFFPSFNSFLLIYTPFLFRQYTLYVLSDLHNVIVVSIKWYVILQSTFISRLPLFFSTTL